MAVLDCSVVNCSYNMDNSCKKENIQVDGKQARITSETCCSSFACRGDCATDCACGCVTKETEVGCTACECTYNHSGQCDAGHIQISGGHADRAGETECDSFKLR